MRGDFVGEASTRRSEMVLCSPSDANRTCITNALRDSVPQMANVGGEMKSSKVKEISLPGSPEP